MKGEPKSETTMKFSDYPSKDEEKLQEVSRNLISQWIQNLSLFLLGTGGSNSTLQRPEDKVWWK